MIKINLLKEKKTKKTLPQPTFVSLKEVKVDDLLKLDKAQYYLSVLLWIGVLGMGVLYWKISKEITQIKREIDQLQAEKNRLEGIAKRISEEKKEIESEMSALKTEMDAIERSKDILTGLKAFYEPFNDSFVSFSSSVPSISWTITYSQSLDIENRKLKTEFDLSSFDYASIGSYVNSLKKNNAEVFISGIERKTTPNGYEYYSTKLVAEKSVGGK
jgi:DNA repair exonuclease SbcCD ATPase subunit